MSKKIVEQLKSGVVEVSFTKKDGTNRHMVATLDTAYIPQNALRGGSVEIGDEVCPVWDMDVKGWRSFRFDSVKTYSPYKW